MDQLTELTQRLAARIAALDAEDLPALAAIHDQFGALATTIAESPAAAISLAPAASLARRSAQSIEKIILREVVDNTIVLSEVAAQVRELQQMVEAATALPVLSSAPSLTESSIDPNDLPLVADFISEAAAHIASAEAAVLRVEESPEDTEAINAVFRSFHTIKGVAGFLNFKQIGALAHAAEGLLDLGRQGQFALAGETVDVILESIDLTKALMSSLADAVHSGNAPKQDSRLPGLIARLNAITARHQPDAASPSGSPATPRPAPAFRTDHADATVKVATHRLDTLINLAGQLVIAEATLRRDISASSQNKRIDRRMSHLRELTRELHDLSMSMRMVPIQGLFQKMARIVRDLTRKLGKEIEFTAVGGETECDRDLIEAISDPLVHMIRNAVDHGIEAPDERVRAGKNRSGRIELMALQQADSIMIRIKDDGRGLNRDKIVRKAVAAGIIAEGQKLTDAEAFDLIFHAGLSTADKVTDISGRGVGMDVVKKNVQDRHGDIEIESAQGKGLILTIRLPLPKRSRQDLVDPAHVVDA